MAPIVDHQAAAISTDQQLTADAHHLTVKNEEEHHQADGQFEFGSSTTITGGNNFHDVAIDDTRDEHDNDDAAAAVIHRISGQTTNNYTNNGSSLFMDECDNYNNSDSFFTEDVITTADLQSSALMTSFDALEDIDLMNSPPSKEQLQELHQYTTTATDSDIAIISADEELARQLQAEEDESARKQREAIIFRKAQKAARGITSTPPRKLKKSWLDDLIGEPFPQEIQRNYARSDSQQNSGSSGLMAAIAAAEARVTSAAIDSSILVDRTNTTASSCYNRGVGGRSNTSSSSSSGGINVDEGITQLSTSISKWWSSNVVNPINSNNNNDSPTTTATSPEDDDEAPRFIDNGSEGYYHGDFLTDTNNKLIHPLQRHGQGIMTYNSGHTFTGNFRNNVFHGWGIYLWNDGDKQRGTWQNGLRHGPCVFHHAASDVVEYGYYDQGKVVGEGVRLNAERTVAWKLVDGKRLEETIEMEEAERIVAERFDCFPIPFAVKKRFVVNDDDDEEEV